MIFRYEDSMISDLSIHKTEISGPYACSYMNALPSQAGAAFAGKCPPSHYSLITISPIILINMKSSFIRRAVINDANRTHQNFLTRCSYWVYQSRISYTAYLFCHAADIAQRSCPHLINFADDISRASRTMSWP